MRSLHAVVVVFFIIVGFSSCQVYKQNVMFKTDKDYNNEATAAFEEFDSSYHIQPDDYVFLSVYSNKGELLVDPNYQYQSEVGGQRMSQEKPKYLVQQNGELILPLVGLVNLKGLTIAESNLLLAEKYSDFYAAPYVLMSLANRRVVVIGSLGGKVIPLENENMNLIEVIALYGGMDEKSQAGKIKLVRGDLKNPDVQLIDLSTIAGLKDANLNIMANDIVYIEPRRKVFTESLRDISPLASLVTSFLTLVIVIASFQ